MKKKNLNIDKADIKAFLGPGSKFEGKLSFDEMVRVDGLFIGEINSSDILVVGDSAEIEGNINVGRLVLSGQFKGNIVAAQSVLLHAPARVEGLIETPVLQIDEQVVFNGEIRMLTAVENSASVK
ncbi:MAG: polymer-forming cytoskeletal protein [Geopsychrobacter sp.]|nr:polymer-forming cytoskeletal protein [Geopsychrobacter sp.]